MSPWMLVLCRATMLVILIVTVHFAVVGYATWPFKAWAACAFTAGWYAVALAALWDRK